MPTVVILTAPGMWELRDNLTPYDAAYVALAELTGATLVTGDERITAAPGIRCDFPDHQVAGRGPAGFTSADLISPTRTS